MAESGVATASQAKRLGDAGFDAVLVGESLVMSSDPAVVVAALRGRMSKGGPADRPAVRGTAVG